MLPFMWISWGNELLYRVVPWKLASAENRLPRPMDPPPACRRSMRGAAATAYLLAGLLRARTRVSQVADGIFQYSFCSMVSRVLGSVRNVPLHG
jgi:hypothetical protein